MAIGVLTAGKSTAGRRAAGFTLAVALAAIAGLMLMAGSVEASSSLALSRSSGLAKPQPVTLTYTGPIDKTGICDAGADFTWDGFDLGTIAGGTDLGTACRYQATFELPPSGHAAVGPHTIAGVKCSNLRSCDREAKATATFAVLAPAITARPRRASPAAQKASPSTSLSPSPSPSVTPAPTPTPTATPTPTPQPTPSPAATQPPTPGPTQIAAVVVLPSASPDTLLAPLIRDVPGPSGLDLAPGVVVTNAALALFFLLLFALTAEILNNTLDDHHDVISGWTDRVAGRWALFCRAMTLEGRFDGLAARGRSGAALHLAAVLLLLGLVYGFLSPEFGPNGAGLVLVLSVMLGLGVLLYTNYGLKGLIVRRAYRTPAGVRTYGLAILVAAICVTFSRFLDFHPGIVYGFVASLAILAPLELSRRAQARLVLAGSAAVLALGLGAFLLLGPLRTAIGNAGEAFVPSLAESVLVILYVGALEGLAVNLLPITYLDGARLWAWSRLRWALCYWLILFLWWQLLFNRDSQYADAFRQSGVLAVAALLGFFTLTTLVVWAAFRMRDARRERKADAGLEAGPEVPEAQSATGDVG